MEPHADVVALRALAACGARTEVEATAAAVHGTQLEQGTCSQNVPRSSILHAVAQSAWAYTFFASAKSFPPTTPAPIIMLTHSLRRDRWKKNAQQIFSMGGYPPGLEHLDVDFVSSINKGLITRGVVMDVGANNGAFSKDMMARLNTTNGRSATRFVIFEPQPQFRERLHALAASWPGGATHEEAAAWTTDAATLEFAQGLKHVHSLGARLGRPTGDKGKLISVRGIDFAAYLRRTLRPAERVYVKMDIEGAEYEVLPRLLMTGALCLVDDLQLEWHMTRINASRRLASWGLRLTLEDTLERGCPGGSRRRRYLHEDGQNNRAPVPGLLERVRATLPDFREGS